MRNFPLLIFLFFSFQTIAQTTNPLIRYPDISDKNIVFTFENDLWIVNKKGGKAHRLSIPDGGEFGKFSPDGKTIAYSANYDGNVDVYTISKDGGVPQRMTYHGMADFLVDWHPNGNEIVFSSSRASGKQRWRQFFKVNKTGGLPSKMPMEHAEFGGFNEDGSKIAFTQKTRAYRTWKRYRGGMSPDIQIMDLKTLASEKITHTTANDEMPMWVGDHIYYLSDAGPNKRFNIWKYNTKDKTRKQITEYKDVEVHFPSLGKNEIVYTAGGTVYVLDVTTEKSTKVNIQIVGDFQDLKPKTISVGSYIQHQNISHDGNRALVEARGEIFSLPAEKGIVKNLTQSSGSAQRFPAWSPNGKMIAWWSDKSGEYELEIYDVEKKTTKTISSFGEGYRYRIYWSPNNEHVAFIDEDMKIWVVNIKTKATKNIDQATTRFHGGLEGFAVSWSPDSQWLTYSKSNESRSNQSIYLYHLKEQKTHQVTHGFYSCSSPQFDPEGKYIYFFTDRTFNPIYSDFDNTWVYPNATSIGVMSLTKDQRFPISLNNDEVEIKEEEEKKEEEGDKKKGKDKKKKGKDDTSKEESKEETIQIDIAGLESRTMILPIPAGNFGGFVPVKGKVIYVQAPVAGAREVLPELKYFDLEENESKSIMPNVFGFTIAANGEKAIVYTRNGSGIIGLAPGAKLENPLPVGKMIMRVDPMEEWKQIYADAWRLERDFFYDDQMHGVDWNAIKTQYAKMVEHACSRSDLNFILGEMIGELNASHTYRGGGDNSERPKRKSVGYLGIDWEQSNDYFKVKSIIKAAPWDTEVVSPLSEPGIGIQEGDYIIAVNGIALNQFKNPYEAFVGLANQTVEIEYNSKASSTDSKTVLIKTLGNETRLRNLAWIEKNRAYVDKVSNGKIGYIYVPSTGFDGQKELVRMFYAQYKKEGLIIDERFNNGGQIPDRFVELLERKPLAYYHTRRGEDWQWPPVAHFGPKAMLINGWSGSGGDAFPTYFKKRGLGPLIGTTTWGGLIGISGVPSLIDYGSVTVPTFRQYELDGKWFPEGIGVKPDIEVAEDPSALAKGKDPQLDRAIEEVLKAIKTDGFQKPQVPAKEKR